MYYDIQAWEPDIVSLMHYSMFLSTLSILPYRIIDVLSSFIINISSFFFVHSIVGWLELIFCQKIYYEETNKAVKWHFDFYVMFSGQFVLLFIYIENKCTVWNIILQYEGVQIKIKGIL